MGCYPCPRSAGPARRSCCYPWWPHAPGQSGSTLTSPHPSDLVIADNRLEMTCTSHGWWARRPVTRAVSPSRHICSASSAGSMHPSSTAARPSHRAWNCSVAAGTSRPSARVTRACRWTSAACAAGANRSTIDLVGPPDRPLAGRRDALPVGFPLVLLGEVVGGPEHVCGLIDLTGQDRLLQRDDVGVEGAEAVPEHR
jgi:hypothetical protein